MPSSRPLRAGSDGLHDAERLLNASTSSAAPEDRPQRKKPRDSVDAGQCSPKLLSPQKGIKPVSTSGGDQALEVSGQFTGTSPSNNSSVKSTSSTSPIDLSQCSNDSDAASPDAVRRDILIAQLAGIHSLGGDVDDGPVAGLVDASPTSFVASPTIDDEVAQPGSTAAVATQPVQYQTGLVPPIARRDVETLEHFHLTGETQLALAETVKRALAFLSDSTPATKWNCSHCTYENEAKFEFCAMCMQARVGGMLDDSPVAGCDSPSGTEGDSFLVDTRQSGGGGSSPDSAMTLLSPEPTTGATLPGEDASTRQCSVPECTTIVGDDPAKCSVCDNGLPMCDACATMHLKPCPCPLTIYVCRDCLLSDATTLWEPASGCCGRMVCPSCAYLSCAQCDQLVCGDCQANANPSPDGNGLCACLCAEHVTCKVCCQQASGANQQLVCTCGRCIGCEKCVPTPSECTNCGSLRCSACLPADQTSCTNCV